MVFDEGGSLDGGISVAVSNLVDGCIKFGKFLDVAGLEERVLTMRLSGSFANVDAKESDRISIPKLIKQDAGMMVNLVGYIGSGR